MTIAKYGLAVLGLLLAYLLLWPVPMKPNAWTPPSAPVAPADTAQLRAVQRIGAALPGPEAIAFDAQGQLYAGLHDGRLLRLSADLSQCSVIDSTSGRPLGLAVAGDGSVYVADALRGLLKLDADGTLSVLSSEADGLHYGFTDDLDVSRDGPVYFTDASTDFGYGHHMEDLLAHSRSGRLLRYDPASGETQVLLKNLAFANGVALGPDESYVLFAETWEYRLSRYWLTGDKAGQTEVFAENLPGFPDNLSFNGQDRFWAAIFAPRNPLLDSLMPTPWARKVIARLPPFLVPKPKHEAHVLGFDLEGHLIADLRYSAPDAYAPITSVEERDGWLYLGSLEAPSLGRIRLEEALAGETGAAPAPLALGCGG